MLTTIQDAIAGVLEMYDKGYNLLAGNEFSDITPATGIVATVYEMAQFSGMSSSTVLSDKNMYPYFSRSISPSTGQISALIDTLLYFTEVQGLGWTDIAILSSTDDYGIDMAENLIEKSEGILNVKTFQQFIPGAEEFDIELREIKNSGARVIFAFMYIGEYNELIPHANASGLVGDDYVWLTGDDLVGGRTFGSINTTRELSGGLLGSFEFIDFESEKIINFYDRWASLDPETYPGAGPGTKPSFFNLMGFDAISFIGKAMDTLDRQGLLDDAVTAAMWTETLRNTTIDGITGTIKLTPVGDRISTYSINYYNSHTGSWEVAFKWTHEKGIEKLNDIVWFSNTTEIPDLDIRDPFHYWSCDDKERKYDPTGKTVEIHSPNGSDVDDIDSDYYCDHFIDCKNLSDESTDGCGSNYLIIFIVFGIITGILILVTFLLFVFVLLFGIILRYQRLRVASPIFLILILFSVLFGYLSIFAWFGKPHSVGCGFQPWLLGLSAISMIAALCAKTFRIWRIFRSEFKRQKISDLELLLLWVLSMIPVIIILTLWTIISTPTAKLKEVDGKDHFVCATGGFTGEPGGLIFFFILVAYGAFILLIGVFLSIVTRKVPSLFNESKLLAISIYNIGFLSAVIIPVFLVVNPFNPFIAWILRTIAILYAFTATLTLQFLPIVVKIVIIDRCKNKKVQLMISKTDSTKISSTVTGTNSKTDSSV